MCVWGEVEPGGEGEEGRLQEVCEREEGLADGLLDGGLGDGDEEPCWEV